MKLIHSTLLLALLSGAFSWKVEKLPRPNTGWYKGDKMYSCVSTFNIAQGDALEMTGFVYPDMILFFAGELCEDFAWAYSCNQTEERACFRELVTAMADTRSFRVQWYLDSMSQEWRKEEWRNIRKIFQGSLQCLLDMNRGSHVQGIFLGLSIYFLVIYSAASVRTISQTVQGRSYSILWTPRILVAWPQLSAGNNVLYTLMFHSTM